MAGYWLIPGVDASALAAAQAAAAEKDGDADDEVEDGEVRRPPSVSTANAAVYSQIMLGQMLAAQQGMLQMPTAAAGAPAAAAVSTAGLSLAQAATLLNG